MLGKRITLHRSEDQGATYGSAVGDILDIQPGDRTAETIDSTKYGGDDDYKEYDYGLLSGGEWTITVRYEPGQTEIEALVDALENGTKEYVQCRIPTPINKAVSFRCLVTTVGIATPKEGHIDRNLTLMVTGRPNESDLV